MKKTILFFSLLLFSLCITAQQDNNGDILKIGDNMPSFTLSSSVYDPVDSKNLEGKVVLINIFATWCPPCQKELAAIKDELWPKYSRNPDFVMLVVGREHTDEQLTKYNQKKKFTFPLYPDPARDFTSLFATKNIPRSYLVDKHGVIVYESSGFTKEEFKDLLQNIELELAR